jgi:heat shock protein HslJ
MPVLRRWRPAQRSSRCALTAVGLAWAAAATLGLSGCHGGGAPTTPRLALKGTTWQLVRVNGQGATALRGGEPATVQFSTDGSATGFAGCNRFRGPYTTQADSLRFGPLLMTRMACASGSELEARYVAALEATRRFAFDHDSLRFLGATGPVAVFIRGG